MSRTDATLGPAARLGALLDDWWPIALTALGAATFAAVSIADDKHRILVPGHPPQWAGMLAGTLLTLAGLVATQRQLGEHRRLARSVNDLEARAAAARASIVALADSELVALNNELRVASQERISLYAWRGDRFELVARYSQNPSYRGISSHHHPTNEGCRWEAWCHGASELVIDAARGSETWIEAHVSRNMSRDRVVEMRLQARTVIAERINSPRPGDPPLGVLLVESETTHEDPNAARRGLHPQEISRTIDRYAARLAGELASLEQLP